MADFTTDLAQLRNLKKKLEDSESQLEEALRRMKDTGPKNLGKRSLDKACEDFEGDWGGEHGEAQTVGVGETQLSAGVRAFLADDQPHTRRSALEGLGAGGCGQSNRAAALRSASAKIRTIPGPAVPATSPPLPYPQVSELLALYHQQTKNLLVSYSPKKLGFFSGHEERRLTWEFTGQAPFRTARSEQSPAHVVTRDSSHRGPLLTGAPGPVTDRSPVEQCPGAGARAGGAGRGARSAPGALPAQWAKPQSSILVASSKRPSSSLRIAPTRVRLSRSAAKTRA